MTLRHDPLLARALAAEVGRRWGGDRAASLHLAREPRAAELRFRDGRSLLFLLHPEEGAILSCDPALPGEGIRFRKLFLGAVRTPPDERILLLPLVDARGRERHRVVVELHTNQWNLLLLDVLWPRGAEEEEGRDATAGELEPVLEDREGAAAASRREETLRVRAALWPRRTAHRTLESGAAYELPPGARAWAERVPSWEAWRELFTPVPAGKRRGAALRGVAWLSSVNVDHVLGDAAREEDGERLEAAHQRYLALRRTAGVDEAGGEDEVAVPSAWLLERPWGAQPYPVSLDEPEARPFPGLLEAMEAALGGPGARERRVRELAVTATPAAAAGRRAVDRREAVRLRRALLARRDRLRKRRAALERELERGPEPEQMRGLGNLLLARLRDVPRGAERITLEDFEGGELEIELDPTLEPAENAEAYFEEAARRERARERIPGEVEATERSLRAVEEGVEAVETALAGRAAGGGEGPSADGGGDETAEADVGDGDVDALPGLDEERIEALWELAGGRAESGEVGREEGGRLPYLRYRSSGGREIRVGRSARTNDELTFHHSSPEDIWLHARQVQGAHVILRWDRKEQNPPRRDLLEAAVAAAVHSGARHSGTVAVDWTRRKYVRKPRKAPPGAVLPDRVQTLFVEPDAELLERMKLGA